MRKRLMGELGGGLLSGLFLVASCLLPHRLLCILRQSPRCARLSNCRRDVLIFVAGYRRPGHDGGGMFRYEPGSQEEPNGGSVFVLQKLPGRVLRLVEPDEDVYAERFGAYGDGDSPHSHADQEAINKCLRR